MKDISTKTGDQGQTSLANGQRLGKDALIIEVIGTLDELNVWLGMALTQMRQDLTQLQDKFSLAKPAKAAAARHHASHLKNWQTQQKFLEFLQKQLFILSAELVQAPRAKLAYSVLTKIEKQSQTLQQQMQKDWPVKFLYPGGIELAARLDVARTVCRRAERVLIRYHTSSPTSQDELGSSSSRLKPMRPFLLKVLNRLSDYLYVLRCWVNWQAKYQEKKLMI